ncbi:MAG: cell division protein ZapB [Treponema sp.]|jgi:FtsZ-binding cell division protein ZapB|nr:cell division protein ZapB [Treponema sp.]
MINLEQVKLLEAKVAKAIDYIDQLSKENADLQRKEAELQAGLETYQRRIDELEGLAMRFREDQARIEDSILAALNRLNQFEETVEKSLRDKSAGTGAAGAKASAREARSQKRAADTAGDGKICFEIPSTEEPATDIPDPLEDTADNPADNPAAADDSPAEKDGELDIF